MTARLVQKPVKGKASCLPIQEELNDNPYLKLRRNTAASLFDGTLQTFIDIIKADDTLIRENDYKLNDLLKDLEYH